MGKGSPEASVQQAVDVLDVEDVRRWADYSVRLLESARAEIDQLNVFPVADRDTGTNLLATMRAAGDAVAAEDPPDARAALQAMADGAVRGASGNSGAIVAQLLRALADVADPVGRVDAAELRAGFRRAAERVKTAVARPVAGTLVTVIAAVAAGLARADVGAAASLRGTAQRALGLAQEALRRTPEQLPVLKAAGVVDAGGRGLVVVLDALVAALSGRLDPPEPAPVAVDQVSAVAAAFEPLAETLGEPPLFEVQYLVAAEQPAAGAAESLRADLDSVADSVVVVDNGNGLLAVHAHTGDVGAVLERGLSRGRASRITVERITEFVAAERAGERAGELPRPAVGRRAVVAASAGTARLPVGLARVLEKEGVRLAEASTSRSEAVVEAALTAAADEVVLLFDVRDAREVVDPAAERLRARGIRVAAVPTRSPVQALAAVAVHDGARPFDDDVVAMAEAAAATRVAELTVARQDALTSAGPCRPGDVLGMIDGEVVEVGRGLLAVALALADRLLGVGVELMTVVVAADVGAGVAETVRRHVRDRSPFTEVTVYDVASPGPGVQSFPDDELYGEIPLILGAE